MVFKGCLVRFQKGVTWTSKGHLLQANWALFASRLVVLTKSACEKYGQNSVFGGWSEKFFLLRLVFKK